jgi:hypothetical protein
MFPRPTAEPAAASRPPNLVAKPALDARLLIITRLKIVKKFCLAIKKPPSGAYSI